MSYVVDGWVNVDVLGKVNKFCQPIPGKVFVKRVAAPMLNRADSGGVVKSSVHAGVYRHWLFVSDVLMGD